LQRLERLLRHATPREFPLTLACLLILLDQPSDGLQAIGQRWKLSNEETRQADAALKHWSTIVDAKNLPWSTVQPKLIDRDAAVILQLAAAVVAADNSDDSGVRLARQALAWPPEKLNPPMLLTGGDLRELGIPEGPQYALILKSIRESQLDGKISSRQEAIAIAKNGI